MQNHKIGRIACILTIFCLFVAAGSGGFVRAAKSVPMNEAPLSTPLGITLVDVTNTATQLLWRRLGNAAGKPLYTYEKDIVGGAPTCVDECAKEFPPLIATHGAVAFDVWSLLSRGGNVKQWAYQGHPLYTYSGPDPGLGSRAYNELVVPELDQAMFDPGSRYFSPKQGWRRAAYTAEQTTAVPAGIKVQSLAAANGYGLVVSNSGMVIYTLGSEVDNPPGWTPLYAPGAAVPTGDFSMSDREDGTRQWAYKSRRLYTYNNDYSPGNTEGLLEQKDAPRVALVYRNFLPRSVSIQVLPVRGALLTTVGGLSLYGEGRQAEQLGGRETRDGYHISYESAKAVNTRGCVDDCTKQWHPLQAASDAVGSGFWEVEVRPDGARQWAYRGSPLYTYSADRKLGDIQGNNRHIIVYGDPQGNNDAVLALAGGEKTDDNNFYGAFGAGFYWHLARLND
jgi:predicted lipoprotein with Yx(FWY)xxD motif